MEPLFKKHTRPFVISSKKFLLQAFSAAISNQTLFSYSLEVIQFVRNLIMFYCLLHPNATYVRRFVFRQVYEILLTPTLLTND